MAEQKEDYSGMTGGLDMSKLPIYGEDSDERIKELRDAQQQALEALQHRYDQPNWWKVAAGFAKPQLGGFLASAGSAAEAMGENTELQRSQQLPIAQMKLQLAQSNMLLNAGKKVADQIHLWQQQHPGETPSSAQIGEWERMAPTSNVVKALKSELESAHTEQGQNLQQIEEQLKGGMNLSQDRLDYLGRPLLGVPKKQTPSTGGGVPTTTPQVGTQEKPIAGSTEETAITKPLPVEPPIVGKPINEEEKPKNTVGVDDYIKAQHTLENIPSGKKNKNSSAMGPSGIVDSTREYLKEKYNLPDGYGTNPDVTAQYDHALIKDQQENLKKNDLETTAINHRLTHVFGNSGGVKLIKADPAQKISEVLSPEAIKANGLNPNMSIGALKSRTEGSLWDQGVNPQYSVQEAMKEQKIEKPADITIPKEAETTEPEKPVIYPPTIEMPKIEGLNPREAEARVAAAKANAAKLEEANEQTYIHQTPLFSGNNPRFTNATNAYDSAISQIHDNQPLAKKVFSLVENNGGLISALNSGIGIHAGSLTANINLPAEAFMRGNWTPEERAYADKLFSSLVQIAMVNMQQEGINMGNVPQGEYMKALSRFVNPNMNALAAENMLYKQKANFMHQKEAFDTVTHERTHNVDKDHSLTPYTDIYNNSKKLRELDAKYKEILRRYDQYFNKRIKAKKSNQQNINPPQ